MGKDYHDESSDTVAELRRQLARANQIIGWMMPYIGSMCPPQNRLGDLNDHCFENRMPAPGDDTKGAPINNDQ